MIRPIALVLLTAAGAAGLLPVSLQDIPAPVRPDDFVLVKTLEVGAGPGWTDTGLDVVVDQEFWFEAAGTISLQSGNPEAECGPEGLKLKLMQQPLPEENLGCLVGRILQHVQVTEDPKTKEKTVREYAKVFYIGKIGPVRIEADGRLFLGPNENVMGDNSGSFAVRIYRRG